MPQWEETPTMALLDGRYQLGECVGQGGMAKVYRAEDLLLGRTVAIKMMRTDADLLATPARARTEMTVLASLNHPSLVKLLDARLVPGSPGYLVMEFVNGATLSDRLRQGALASADVAHLACELAAALYTVHEAGVVHRDVKPSNILLARAAVPSRPFHAKLTDFGVAYLADSTHLTTPGTVIGTAAFLAPEQVRGAAASPAADIYALGLVLLEALTGERAFPQASGIGAVMARLVESPTIPDGLGPAWVDLLSRMTALDPALRPTALEVAARAQTMPADNARSLVTAPLVVPAPAVVSAPFSALSAVSATSRNESDTRLLPTASRRSAGHRARPKTAPRWIAAAAVVGSAAAAVLALQIGSWSGEAVEQPPALIATVPTVTEPESVPAAVVAEEPVDSGVDTQGPVEPVSMVRSDSAEGRAEQAQEAGKQAEQAAKLAEESLATAEQAQPATAEDERTRAEDALRAVEEAQKKAEQALQKNAREERGPRD
jgi:serine/threonine protein kinase